MGLRDTLERHNVPIPDDFDERLDIVVSGLKKKPDFKQKLEKFKKHRPTSGPHGTRGGAEEPAPVAPPIKRDSEDWLGPHLRWFLKAITSPYARTMLEGIFIVVFFISYLERTPVIGSILSTGLDLMLAGGKIATKSFQSAIPAIMGLAPIPYASTAGIVMAASFGFMVWPIFAIVSLSRQDFTSAVESFIRIIPPPIGDVIANTFLEGNRTIARIDEKRIKLGNDIASAMNSVSEVSTQFSQQAKEGLNSLAEQVKQAAQTASSTVASVKGSIPTMPTVPPMPTMPTMPTVPPMPTMPTMPTSPTEYQKATSPVASPPTTGGFHRRTRRKSWRTKKTRTTRVLTTRRISARR
jgi:hypothetical protein